MLLKNKLLIFVTLTILLSSIIIATEICQVNDVKTSLKNALYSFLTNPSSSELSVEQIKDLLVFYLKIEEGAITANCSEIGYYSKDTISAIMGTAENISTNITCTGGTPYGECSSIKPRYCYAGTLVNRCDICGCDGYLCDNVTGLCDETGPTITCNVDSNCGTNDYTGENYCSGNVYRNYITYNCTNPNTESSDCTDKTTPILIETCEHECANGACIQESDIIYIDSCQRLDQPNKYYKLTQPIKTTGSCFRINADGITLDLNGYRIRGSKVSGSRGVSVEGHTGITIKNGKIYTFYYGISLYRSSNNTLTDIKANSNYDYGISLHSSSDNTLTNITANNNGRGALSDSGIYLYRSSYNTLTDITANSNSWDGIYLKSSSNNILTDITANSNQYDGILLAYDSNNNQLTTITTNLNGKIGVWSGGIYLHRSSYNTITDITAYSNKDNGIYLRLSSYNTLTNIKANLNYDYGIYLYVSSSNTLTDITANSRNEYGIYLAYSSNNIITDSNFCDNPIYCDSTQTFTNNYCIAPDGCGDTCQSC